MTGAARSVTIWPFDCRETSMSREVILHIGLHKTATRFLQRAVFNNLDSGTFEVNPEPFTELLHQHMRRPDDVALTEKFSRAAAALVDDPRKLLISLPDISGDMYNSHDNYLANRDVVKKLFPEAKVIYFVRNQADWLVSAYRQSMQKGACGPIEVFLNYRDGEFQPKRARYLGNMRNVNALDQRFYAIYEAYAEAYGADNVYLVRYEDFRRNRQGVVDVLCQALGIDSLPVSQPSSTPNRSFSALALNLFCSGFWLRMFPPRASDKPRGPAWLRRYGPTRLLRVLRRHFIRKIWDRLWYVDWDLLAKDRMRERLNEHYTTENEKIRSAARAVASDEKN